MCSTEVVVALCFLADGKVNFGQELNLRALEGAGHGSPKVWTLMKVIKVCH
jgi:hypothetical protein